MNSKFFISGVFLLLTGCLSPYMKVALLSDPQESSSPKFEIARAGTNFTRNPEKPSYDIQVLQLRRSCLESGESCPVFWYLRVNDQVDVLNLQYGVLPKGGIEFFQAKPLKFDHQYTLPIYDTGEKRTHYRIKIIGLCDRCLSGDLDFTIDAHNRIRRGQ